VSAKQLDRVLTTPWTLDGQTFSDRIWSQKAALIAKVQTELSQALLRGDAPHKATLAIAKQFGVSKSQAGRLVMTESAYFAAEGQKDCYHALDVDRFEIVATLDKHTSELCQELDGHVEDMKNYKAGVTAPPFHPWCRSTTIPYFPDNFGERAARNADGEVYYVPSDMKYAEWKEKFVEQPAQMQYNGFRDSVHAQIRTDYPLTLNAVRQNKHIEGTADFDPRRGTLTVDPAALIAQYAGHGDPIRTNSGAWNQRERFAHTSDIGIWRNEAGLELPTNRGIIHYSKNRGAHIVPADPRERRREP